MSEMTLVFFQQIVKMFAMLFIGFAAVKLRLMPAGTGKGLSQVTVAVIRPCAVLCAFQVAFTQERLLGLGMAVAGAALTHGVLILLTGVLERRMGVSPVERLSMIYSNCGDLLMPLIAASMGPEWVFYSCAYTGVVQVFVWTQGKQAICREPRIDWKRALCNINILAVAAGCGLFCLGITVPFPLGPAMDSLGDMLGAASMLSIGISFATLKDLSLKRLSRVLAVSAFRLIFAPLAMLAVFLLLRFHTLFPSAEQILLITVLSAGAPTAVVVTQLAQLYDREIDHAGLIGVVTMLCSLVTLPALIWVYEAATALI